MDGAPGIRFFLNIWVLDLAGPNVNNVHAAQAAAAGVHANDAVQLRSVGAPTIFSPCHPAADG